MALMNRRLNHDLETVFLMPDEKYTYTSSRLIKEVFMLGGEVSAAGAAGRRGTASATSRPVCAIRWPGRGKHDTEQPDGAHCTVADAARTAEADRLRRQGIDVVDLGAGEPDFPTPEHIKAAAQQAIADNFTKYTPSAGIMELRQAICDRYRADYGVEYTPEETIVTAGGKQALYNVAMALLEEGDEVITHGPSGRAFPSRSSSPARRP